MYDQLCATAIWHCHSHRRHVMWAVCNTNNNHKVMSGYPISTVMHFGGYSKRLHVDPGTEIGQVISRAVHFPIRL